MIRLRCAGPVVEPGPRRRPAEPQIVGSNPTRPALPFVRFGSCFGFHLSVIRYYHRFFRVHASVLIKREFEGWHGQELVVQHIQTNLWETLRLASFGRRTISIFDKFESSDSWKALLTH